MPWEPRKGTKHRYFTTSARVGGRVVRRYFGGGEVGRIAAQRDAEARARRLAERTAMIEFRDRLRPADDALNLLGRICTLLLTAKLTAEGFHRHDRGPWKKRRGGIARAGR